MQNYYLTFNFTFLFLLKFHKFKLYANNILFIYLFIASLTLIELDFAYTKIILFVFKHVY